MNLPDIVSSGIGLLGAAGAVLLWFETRGGRKQEDRRKQLSALVKHAVADGVQPLSERLTIVETKLQMFLGGVSFDMAKIIHQPHPERVHIDDLIDAFLAGRLTVEQKAELTRILESIRDHQHGEELSFPVLPGEQAAASLLLHTLEHGLPAEPAPDETPEGRDDDGQ